MATARCWRSPAGSRHRSSPSGSASTRLAPRNGRELFALSQGVWDLPPTPENEGKPAAPNTGRLRRVQRDGSFASVVEGLDRPTSLEFIDHTAFVVTLTGEVLRIDGVRR